MHQDVHAEALTPRPNECRRFVHKRFIGAVKGFARGGISGAAGGFLSGGRATRPTTTSLAQRGGGTTTTTRTRIGPFGSILRRDVTQTQVGTVPIQVGELRIGPAGPGPPRIGAVAPTADGCPKGFHLNKSAYSLKDGRRIEERSLCVKNRRRNNDNGTAALRAARRLVGRKKHQETIDKALKAIAPASRRRSSSQKAPVGATIVSTAG